MGLIGCNYLHQLILSGGLFSEHFICIGCSPVDMECKNEASNSLYHPINVTFVVWDGIPIKHYGQ